MKFGNATFPYKTALSEANVKTNKMQSTKYRLITKNGVSPVTISFSGKLRASIPVLDVDLMYQLPKSPYSQFS